MDYGFVFPFIIFLTSLLSATGALFLLTKIPRFDRRGTVQSIQSDDAVFVFDDEFLIDATPSAQKLLDLVPGPYDDWHRFLALATPRFPELRDKFSRLAEFGEFCVSDATGTALLRANWLNGIARITITNDANQDMSRPVVDQPVLDALEAELHTLRSVVSDMPGLAWQTDSSGDISWANRSYLQLVEDHLGENETLTWPLPNLFHQDNQTSLIEGISTRRVSIQMADETTRWFDCIAGGNADVRTIYATPAEAAVNAETTLAQFHQTLAQTFAVLPTGLAIFNRSRNLVMFNPALTDLFLLEPEFLISRPSLGAFLDRLRDKQMVPEQKNFSAWRRKMETLEREAASGLYKETWALPSGQTLKLTGRPHPDGAVAFLFEDISSEVGLTRRFRTEIEVNQAVMDELERGVAVFSPTGILTMTNNNYVRIWGHDPANSLGDTGISDVETFWPSKVESKVDKVAILSMMAALKSRIRWTGQFDLSNGLRLKASVKPISGGATMVSFFERDPAPAFQSPSLATPAS